MLPIGMLGGAAGGMAAGGGGSGILSMILKIFGGSGGDGGSGRPAIKQPQNQTGMNSILAKMMNMGGQQQNYGIPNSMDVFNNYSQL